MRRWFEPVLAGLCLGYAAAMAVLFARGLWILDSTGHAVAVDFLSFHAAGWFADHGQAVTAYDWRAMHDFHTGMTGVPFHGFFGWAYPPLFFLPVMLLALLPYPLAFGIWVLTTLALMAWILWWIGGRNALLLGLALPPILANALVGQNGFLTAALFGAALLAVPRKPLLAGILIVLLTYKPQFGILLPIALVAGNHWRALVTAIGLTLLYAAGCWLIVPDLANGFLDNLVQNNSLFLGSGTSGFFKMQSLYGLLRGLGAPAVPAWAAQGALAIALTVLVTAVWRQDVRYSLKAAALAAAALLATPYAYFYDLPLLAVALAFLWRDRPFDRLEVTAVLFMILLLGLCALVTASLGLFATTICLGLTVRRIRKTNSPAPV